MIDTLTQLAFSGALNGTYSILLLLTLGFVLYQWFAMRKSQSHWQELWSAFEMHCHGRIDDLVKYEGPADDVKEQLSAHYLSDLVAHINVYPTPPDAEESARQMMEVGLSSHVILEEKQATPERWEKWPSIAVLLGLLGTFIGLTAALARLPLGGGLKQLNEGLQAVLPVMSAAFWTSVCGLFASLVLRAYHNMTVKVERARAVHFEQLHEALTKRIRRELYPHLAQHGVLLDQTAPASVPTPEVSPDLTPLLAKLEQNQEVFLASFAKQWEEWQKQWKEQQDQLKMLPAYLVPLAEEMQSTQKVLEAWTQSIADNAKQLERVNQEVSNTLNPIAHTEQLLQERMTSLTRQHESLTGLVETLLAYEKQLPDKLKELLQMTLRPAHRILQRSGQSLNQSIEMLMERNTQEREDWRHELQQLVERFQVLERITMNAGSFVRELTQITRQLSDISDHLRFRPRPTLADNEVASDYESLDNEIDQLLESFDDRNAQSPPPDLLPSLELDPPQALPQEPEPAFTPSNESLPESKAPEKSDDEDVKPDE